MGKNQYTQPTNLARRDFLKLGLLLSASALVPNVSAASSGLFNFQNKELDTNKIETLIGLKGVFNEEEKVFKISSPRNDVKVLVDKWAMPPFMGLTSWAAFKSGVKKEAMVMGDLVLFQDEVNPVMGLLLEGNIEVTALHNHFFFDDPKVYFMHIGGEGSIEQLASGIKKAFDEIKRIRAISPKPTNTFNGKEMPSKNSITPQIVESIIGVKGESKEGMYKVVIGREVKMSCGCTVDKTMGINTWAAFAGTNDNAVVDGDFVVVSNELQNVLKTLRKSEINIVAIHNHMTEEKPRLFFLHYWGRGRAANLANAIKSALKYTS